MKKSVLSLIIVPMCMSFGCGTKTEHSSGVYQASDLETKNLPAWDVTNAIPITPDKAILSALSYVDNKVKTKHIWVVETINLYKVNGVWLYDIFMVDREPGHSESEFVRVLMNGEVWKPESDLNPAH